MHELFAPEVRQVNGVIRADPDVTRKVVARYPYKDEQGVTLYDKVRYEPKGFVQRRADPTSRSSDPFWDGWSPCLGNVRRVLYRLPDMLNAAKGLWPIVIVEGEKDADRLASLGLHLCPTTNTEGSNLWRPEYGQWLTRRRVVILPDHDAPGRRFGWTVFGACCEAQADSCRLLDLWSDEPIPDHGGKDVSDWLDAGHTPQELVDMIRGVRAWK